MIRIDKSIYDKFSAWFLFLAFMEFLYTNVTGSKSAIILAGFLAVGFVLNVLKGLHIYVRDVLCFAVAALVLVYSKSEESIRYTMLLCAIVFWTKFSYKRLDILIELLVVIGAALTLFQMIGGRERAVGFFANSPTQFACTMLVCEAYLMVWANNNGFNFKKIVLAGIAVVLIIFTGTRSNLLAAVAIYAGSLILMLVNYLRRDFRMTAFVVIAIVAIIAIMVLLPAVMDVLNTKLNRSNAQASTNTRMEIYRVVLGSWLQNLWTMLFGHGAGHVEILLKEHYNTAAYIPGHQDFFVILCEFGLLGGFVLFFVYLWKHKAWLYFILVFSVCSFHNIILTPTTMILMTVTMKDLECRGYKLLVHNKKLVRRRVEPLINNEK